MIRAAVLIAVCLPTLASAEGWTASLRTQGKFMLQFDQSGDALSQDPYGATTSWNGTEIFQSDPGTVPVNCATARAFEIDHYAGDGQTYNLQVLITFEKRDDGIWGASSPDIYLDIFDNKASESSSYSYSGFNGTAKVLSLTCVGNDVDVRYSFRGQLDNLAETGDKLMLTGSGSAVIPLKPYSDY